LHPNGSHGGLPLPVGRVNLSSAVSGYGNSGFAVSPEAMLVSSLFCGVGTDFFGLI